MTKVTYLDHSGFAITLSDAILVFDFYRDPSHALEHLLKANPQLPVIFFVSHHHHDHYNPHIYEIAQNHKRTYVMSNDVLAQNVPSTLAVAGMSAGDVIDNLPGKIMVKAYGSTDKGVSFLVTLPDGKKIFHAGDLNCWHWKDSSTPQEIQRAETKFKSILHRIAEECPQMYIAMFPVDVRQGSDYAQGANEFLTEVKVDNFFPMHFWGDYEEACDFKEYVPAKDVSTKCHCLHRPGESVEL